MKPTFVVTGTDTGIGKTVFSAALAGALRAYYWKPVQAGLDETSDSERVTQLSGLPPGHILPEAYRLTTPCSPHRAAELDNIMIEPEKLALPAVDGSLIVEGAGGVAVPLRRDHLHLDQFMIWQKPVIIVARTDLGTINHSLLTIDALKARKLPIHGIAFVGGPHQDSEQIIGAISGIKSLGRLPFLPTLNAETLRAAFADHFDLEDFT